MIDPDKLNRLREKYSGSGGADIHSPEFRQVAALQFSGGRRKQPFSGIPTLLNAPYNPEAAILPDFGGLEVALIGVPMDLGVTNRSGARFGPRALRTIERIGPYEHVLRMVPSAACRLADVGDVPLSSRFDLEACHHDIESFYGKVLDAGVIPLSVGGDHSISQSILKALGRERPVGMIHFDAHCDTSGPYEGSKFHHGGPFRQAVLDGVLDPERTVQIGIRGSSEYLWEFSYDSGMTVIHAEEVARRGIPAVIEQARRVAGDGPVYVSFDVDCLDPVFAPGTGTPEVGGLTTREAVELLRGLAGLDVIGGDVVEVAPQYDANTTTALAGAQMLFEILCLAVKALEQRRG
ncbi:agmatinase [Azospirillum sp. 412522]|nr:agmatinase [Azospirillum sp. 412522]MBY6265707.1 agmatinase [Azospirillum sp. 412522]